MQIEGSPLLTTLAHGGESVFIPFDHG